MKIIAFIVVGYLLCMVFVSVVEMVVEVFNRK
jgi:hypothetical protein